MNEENQMIGEGVEDAESDGGSEQDGREMPQDSDDDPHIQETWIERMRRRTRLTENILESLRLDDWVQAQRRRKWGFAGHSLRREDGRWSYSLLVSVPSNGVRGRGRPKKRWTDVLDDFFKHAFEVASNYWMLLAAQREEWRALETEFVDFESH